jgi:3-oxoacyl-[acyl-carrier protein] reductase
LSLQVALVTGGARGIGLNIGRALAEEGMQVRICDNHQPSGSEAQARFRAEGHDVNFLHADLSSADAATDVVRTVVAQVGRLDLLVNNARAGARTTLEGETEANWDLAFAVGAKAAFFASRAAIEDMRKRHSGAIVNVSSVAARVVTHDAPSYHAAKAALIQLTRYLAVNAAPLGVRVNCVLPGFIVKDEHRPRFEAGDNVSYRALADGAHPVRRTGRSDEIAQAVLFLASEQASFINGEAIVVDGGLTLQEPFNLALNLRRDGGAA